MAKDLSYPLIRKFYIVDDKHCSIKFNCLFELLAFELHFQKFEWSKDYDAWGNNNLVSICMKKTF